MMQPDALTAIRRYNSVCILLYIELYFVLLSALTAGYVKKERTKEGEQKTERRLNTEIHIKDKTVWGIIAYMGLRPP